MNVADTMPLTQEKLLDSSFTNNNDHSYLHKKFKKMASTIPVYPANLSKAGDNRYKEAIVSTNCNISISNGSIAAAHPEIEKIKENKQLVDMQNAVKNVQTNYNDENIRIGNINNIVQVSGKTSFTNEFANKTENLESDLIKDTCNGGAVGRHVCPYCKLSCAKPSVLQKHIRAHTNERPYPCVPCGFAFKTKSNLYKHRRSRTHALRLQGSDVSISLNDDEISAGSDSDTSIPHTSVSETSSDISLVRTENLESNDSTDASLNSTNQHISSDNIPATAINLYSTENSKSKSIYKPKFRAALYRERDEKDNLKKSISPNADFLTEHISKIISDNEAIVDVIDTPLQKKYGKIKQIAESKQLADLIEMKPEPSPLNLTKSNNENESSFRKRSHSESFSQNDYHKHPLNPEGSIIKDLLLKTKINGLGQVTGELIDGPLFVCPLCQIIFRSADNLETHRIYYCKGNINNNTSQKDMKTIRPENVFLRSNSINVRLPETTSASFSRNNHSAKISPSKTKPENLTIMKPETSDIVAPLPSPGPLLGNTRLVDSRVPSDFIKKTESLKARPMASPKRRIDCRSDSYSPRLIDNISPRSSDMYGQLKIRCLDGNAPTLRSLDEISQHIKHNSTSLQMFGGEVKILDHSGSTTTLRIEPSKNQLSPILIQQNLSPSRIANDPEASSIVVRSGLHSGGTIMHNPPTPKEIVGTPQPQTPRITISSANSIASTNLPNINEITHFQFPPLSAITAFNPLTLPPLSPTSPNGATTILHGGKLIPHVPGIPGPNTPGIYVSLPNAQTKCLISNENNSCLQSTRDVHCSPLAANVHSMKNTIYKYDTQQLRNNKSPNLRHIDMEKRRSTPESINGELPNYTSAVPIIKIKNVDESNLASTKTLVRSIMRQDGAIKRNIEGVPRIPVLKENILYQSSKLKSAREKINNPLPNNLDIKSEKDLRNFNFENIITKAEIYNNQIPSSSEVQKNTNAQDMQSPTVPNDRSETSYFQKNVIKKQVAEEIKPKFLRPSTLPLKPGTFTPKRHHGITPNANTMPLVSPETPRPAKAYGQLYLNGNAYTYLGLKCSTKVFYCTINRPQPTYVPNQEFLSMYSNWQLLSELTPDPLGLSASSAMFLYDSRHRPQNVAIAMMKQDLILTHSSQWNTISKDNNQLNQLTDTKKLEENKFPTCDNVTTPKKELTGGFESNEEYTYVRGRGRGRYVCSECGIRCKKPSMLKKHIRTHTDVRPYTCVHCAFSFKTKGNLTKHMKSKAHYKKCCELGINPNEGNDAEGGEMAQCSGETDDDTDSEGDEGNEGETESSDTEAYKSRLPEHEAAHCLLSLGGVRPTTSATPGLITSARPSTYPYTPTGLENIISESNQERLPSTKSSSIDSTSNCENEPMDLSKSELKSASPNIPDIQSAREYSVLASLASNTAKTKLTNHQVQWSNGEPMLHTYLTERALLDTKIKQSQLTSNLSKIRKLDLEKSSFIDSHNSMDNKNNIVTSVITSIMTPSTTCKVVYTETKISDIGESDTVIKAPSVSREDVPAISECPVSSNVDTKSNSSQPSSNAENAKHVVSEYLKHARINLIKSQEDSLQNQIENINDDNSCTKMNNDENAQIEEHVSGSETVKLPSLDHDPVARKVVIGVGGVAYKVTKGKDFESNSYSPGRLMEDGRRVCDFCNKTFTKPSQLRLHLNIHYMERPFRCSVCAVSFRTRGHLQKHERSGSHHNKVSMTSTFGAATSFNPRPFRCSDCNIAFRIHGHLAKHLRSKMHVMRLECLFKLPFGTFTEIERAGVSLTDIDTTDCASSLASLQTLARKLHEKDPTKLEYREPNGANIVMPPTGREFSDDEDSVSCENVYESEKDSDVKTTETNEGQEKDTGVNYSATDI